MRWIDLRLSLDAHLLEDRYQRLAGAAERIFGLPHVDDAKATLTLSRNMDEQALDGPVSRRVERSYRP